MQRLDVVIVGAGPAGAAAATHLARAGRSVILVDRATFPRDKCCGDGLTTLALRQLEELGFEPPLVTDWMTVPDAWLRAPGGRQLRVPLPRDAGIYAAVAPRSQLDAALVDVSRKAGATTLLGAAFSGFDELHADGDVVLRLEDGATLRARHVIAADGTYSPVRKALDLDLDGYRGEWHAFRQYVADVSGPAAERLYVWFEADLLPGYAWSFPLPDERANFGFGVLRTDGRKGAALNALWHDLLTRSHIREALGTGARMEDRVLAWPIPARVTGMPLSNGTVLFAGDAAAASDVLTGEGIGQALLMGRIAAEAITAGGPASSVAARYGREVRRHLFADHRMSALLGRVLAHRGGVNGALGLLAHSGTSGRRNFARWMFEDEPRAVVVTPGRWHRRFLARPGAFTQPPHL
ncbi:MAG: geranylgeranyl reductase family protein [Actinomycetota bacterium]|nr:geranylgeranyl reductase family protein [Actinomycetota bacterium]